MIQEVEIRQRQIGQHVGSEYTPIAVFTKRWALSVHMQTAINWMFRLASVKYIAIIVLLAGCSENADKLQNQVIGISDGDTITVLDSSHKRHKVRLAGIDAPELRQPFGIQSKQSLSSMVYGKQVIIEFEKYDRYGRIVGKVLANNVDVNLEQIKLGMAWHYKKYQSEQPIEDQIMYAQAEEAARNAKIGLWRTNMPLAPWEFRKSVKRR